MKNQLDTICAISTPRGNAALAIIRISGNETLHIVKQVTKTKVSLLKYNKMYKTTFYESERVLDEGMICLFKAPKSYTGEDMAELYCHGNDFTVSQVLESVLKYCRLAEKGEFTFRAFLNRKIDLTQAEAVGNLLNAQTKQAQKAALLQLEGRLYHKIKSTLDKLIELRILFELAIDFIEEEVPEFDSDKILIKINSILEELQVLINTAHDGIIAQEGIKICLAGAPNVGKSSVFNAFLETERAIITPIPGTTRDYLEERFSLNGYLIRLFDTAGIHESDDLVEQIGIERSLDIIQKADLVFYITSPDIDEKTNDDFIKSLPQEKTVKVLNKADLLPNRAMIHDYVLCSTITKDGLNDLKKDIISRFKNIDTELESGILTNARQLACVKNSYECLLKAKNAVQNEMGIDFITFDIQQASYALEEIIGRVSSDDILDRIFSEFCIGK